MTTPAIPQSETNRLPVLTSETQNWDNIWVEQFQHPAGEASCHYKDVHTICLSLASRPIRMFQVQNGKSYTGLYGKGDISIMSAGAPFFARWDSDDNYLQIRVTSRLIQRVAREALDLDSDRWELLSQFRTRDPQIEAIGLMLMAELQQKNVANKLYIESLSNVLAVHLIRNYGSTQLQIPVYAGGLPQRQVMQVLDYIQDHLQEDIQLADLAALLGMSQFHFSRQFKQTMGITPYQYLLQQRVERAKHLLKHSDRPIIDIALTCGFNSHSHLSKQFRQIVGISPKAYRSNSL